MTDKGRTTFGLIVDLLVEHGILTVQQVEYAMRVREKLQTETTLLDVLKELGYVDDETILSLLRKNRVKMRIGDLLVELGELRADDLQAALKIQREQHPGQKLGEVLTAHNFIDENRFIQILSSQLGFPYVELELVTVDPTLFSPSDLEVFERHNFIPVKEEEDGKILVAFADPLDEQDQEVARSVLKRDIVAGIAKKEALRDCLKRLTRNRGKAPKLEAAEDSAVGIVEQIIYSAIDALASDIHIEPFEDRLRIRFRKDGVLVHFKDYPVEVVPSVSSRLKILCGADIAEKRRHQDGRMVFEHASGPIDIRVSFFVTIYGEKIVMRILNQAQLMDIREIGMPPKMLERFIADALDLPTGVTIITGPTGSGKTTTVYSCIGYLHKPQVSIVTAEDPVEFVIDGIAQCSIDPKINLTYEETLRHIVRQDPDIVVIGEIRDPYSAEVAVQTALTGHKVLTTFHTEDSIGGLIRLINMDIEAFLISTTVVSVAAQRLVRRVCPHCKQNYTPSLSELRRLGYTSLDIKGAEFVRGQGCARCNYTGYAGREAVFELLFLNEPVRDALLEKRSSREIRNISLESTGLVTLMEAGIIKAAKGITSIEELLRCLPMLRKPRPVAQLRKLMGE